MPTGIEVFVDEGFATIGVPDKSQRDEVLATILEHTPAALVETQTRSGPFKLYRIPEGNARAAGLIDGDTSTPPIDRQDLGKAQDLVDADPQITDRGDQHGEYRTPMAESTVRELAYQAMPDGSNGIITGPLRPNKPEGFIPPGPPPGATISSRDLQDRIKANTPNPADYAPARVPLDQRVPAAQGTIAAVVDRSPAGDPGPTVLSSPGITDESVTDEGITEVPPEAALTTTPERKAPAKKAPAKKAPPRKATS